MRHAVSLLFLLVILSPSRASEETRLKALNAVGIYASLAVQCDDIIEADLEAAARMDAVVTLVAGGYSAEEAEGTTGMIFTKLADTPETTTVTEPFCTALLKNIVDNRDAFHAELEAAR